MSEQKFVEIKEEKFIAENNTERETVKVSDVEIVEKDAAPPKSKQALAWIVTAVVIGLCAVAALIWTGTKRTETAVTVEANAEESEKETGKFVRLDQEMLNSAGIEIEGVTQRPAIAKLYTTGTVELNPEKTEMATPLVGGRIENVFYGVGDYVQQGAVMAIISSPQLAQLHGKMHEAQTRYELAQRNLARVQKAENRVAVLQAKAKMDEAEATLKRTRRLIELGAGAGKDLISAETNYKSAKAEYDFQSNISLNKEIQEAKAEVETSRVDMTHIQDEMRSLGVTYNLNDHDHKEDSSLVRVRSPLSGVVTERKFNAGAGIEAASPIFAISNLSTVYVIANVPESSVGQLSVGSIAEIKSPVTGTINGRVSYISPQLDEATRTARVRLEVPNENGKLRAGMFAEVGFNAGTNSVSGEELVVSSEAIQRSGGKTIVFVPKSNEAGVFEVREVEAGGEVEGYTRILSGLQLGETVVTKGSFVLKTQLEKSAMEEE